MFTHGRRARKHRLCASYKKKKKIKAFFFLETLIYITGDTLRFSWLPWATAMRVPVRNIIAREKRSPSCLGNLLESIPFLPQDALLSNFGHRKMFFFLLSVRASCDENTSYNFNQARIAGHSFCYEVAHTCVLRHDCVRQCVKALEGLNSIQGVLCHYHFCFMLACICFFWYSWNPEKVTEFYVKNERGEVYNSV